MAASDMPRWDIFPDSLWLLHNFMEKYKYIKLPTNGGWSTSNVNGSVTQAPLYIFANTSVTANSRGLGYCIAFGLNSGDVAYPYISWSKRFELSFALARASVDTEVVARLQLKEIATEGVLAAKGIGLKISNLTMIGEAYGTALQTTGTLKTLTDGRLIRVKIVKTDTAVEFWVDGVLVGSLTGTAVPNVGGIVAGYLVLSIVNGATGGVNAFIQIGNLEVVQAW